MPSSGLCEHKMYSAQTYIQAKYPYTENNKTTPTHTHKKQAREKAQQVKYLLCKHEDPEPYVKSWAYHSTSVILASGRWRQVDA